MFVLRNRLPVFIYDLTPFFFSLVFNSGWKWILWFSNVFLQSFWEIWRDNRSLHAKGAFFFSLKWEISSVVLLPTVLCKSKSIGGFFILIFTCQESMYYANWEIFILYIDLWWPHMVHPCLCAIYNVLLTWFNVYLINYSGPGIKNPSWNRFHHLCKFRLDYVSILLKLPVLVCHQSPGKTRQPPWSVSCLVSWI